MRKQSKWIALFSVVAVWLIMFGNNNNPDYAHYLAAYNSGKLSLTFESGFALLSRLAKSFGLSYNAFLAFVFASNLLIICFVTKEITDSYHLVIVCYITMLMFYDTIQVRFFIEEALFCLSVYYLSKGKNVGSIIVILLNTLFHNSAWLLLPMVLLLMIAKQPIKLSQIIFVIMIGVIILFWRRRDLLSFLSREINRLGSGLSIHDYLEVKKQWNGYIYPMILQFVNVLISYWSMKCVVSYHGKESCLSRFATLVYCLILLSTVAAPLVMINMNFNRFFRINNILLFIVLGMCDDIEKYKLISAGKRPNSAELLRHYPVWRFAAIGSIALWRIWMGIDLVTSVLSHNILNFGSQ